MSVKESREAKQNIQHQFDVSAILNSVTNAIFLIDHDGVIAFVNHQVKKIFGYEENELLGQKIEILIPKSSCSQHIKHREKYLKNQLVREMGIGINLFACRKNGSIFPCEIGLSPLNSAEKDYVVCGLHDISKRKETEDKLLKQDRLLAEKNTELESIYSTSPLGMCFMDTDFRYQRCNEKLAKINGIPATDHIGKSLKEIVPEAADTMESIYREVMETGEPVIDVQSSVLLVDADSTRRRYFSTFYYPVNAEDGVALGVCSIVQEVTDRIEAEQSLQKVHDQLENRVLERTEALTETNIKLREEINEREKVEEELRVAEYETSVHRERLAHLVRVHTLGEMASGIAHEINQPLAAIGSYAEACQRHLQVESFDAVKLKEVLEKISGQARRAGSVVGRLRAMMQRRTVNPKEIDINSLVDEVSKIAELDIRSNDCQLTQRLYPLLPRVICDQIQIQQVVLNLLRNAIDAMTELGEGVSKEIVVETGVRDNNMVMVSVLDHGVGVAELDAEKVFEAFYTTKDSGLGIGLAICRSIIDAHGGELICSENDEGRTVFSFTLPMKKDELSL